MSRTKDVVFETLLDPLDMMNDGFCYCLGLTGVAEKVIAMYDFMYSNQKAERNSVSSEAMTTMWTEMSWDRRKYC